MKKLRVAIIGTGMIANSAHFPALNVLIVLLSRIVCFS